MVDDPVVRGKEKVDHAGQHDHGNEVRHVDGCLAEAFEPFHPQLVQQDRHDDRDREAEEDSVEIQQEGVQEHPSAVIAAEEFFKILQAHPLAPGDTEAGLVIPESDLDAIHRAVTENNEEGQARKQQHPQLPVPAYGPRGPLPESAAFRCGGNGNTHQKPSFCVPVIF